MVHPEQSEPGRGDAWEADGTEATLCGVHQRDVSVQGPAIWAIANWLRSGLVSMGDIRSQEQSEVGRVMPSVGSTLRPRLVTCDWHCRITSRAQRERYVDYSTLARDEELRESFNAAVVTQLEDSPCDLDNASTSLTRLTKCVTDAARETLPLKHSQPLRKRHVSERTEQLYDEWRRNYARQSDDERKEATRAITVSSRDDYREYVNGLLDDIEGAESVGNMRKVTKLANKDRFSNINPSKGADGKKIVSTTHLLGEWKTFLGSKFKRPASDENRNIESTAAQEDSLSVNELNACLLASGKATGWDNIPIGAYRGSLGARSQLFRICRLMWTTEHVPTWWEAHS